MQPARETVREILEGLEGVLFLDNAYVEFSGYDYLPLMKKHENLVLGRTFSKVYSLAGLRIGYAFTPRWLPPWYQRAGTPFAVNSVSAAAAAAALTDTAHAERYIVQVKRWRKRFASDVKYPGPPLRCELRDGRRRPHRRRDGGGACPQGSGRPLVPSFAGLEDHYIRVSIGEDWENELFVQVINTL